MRKNIIILCSITFSCIVLIYTLHKICLEQNLKIGNFERNFSEKKLNKIDEINLSFDAENFAGFSENSIFFSSNKLTEISKYDLKTKKIISKRINHKNHNSNIINNVLFSFDPNIRKMYRYNIDKLDILNETNLNVGFDRALAIDENTILLRSATERYTKNIFSKFNVKTKENKKLKIQLNDSLVVDGGLETDGFFSFNDSTIIFTQYKKGSFYKINKNLDKITHFTTIDNIQKVEGVSLTPDSSFYFIKPVLNSNLLTSINKNKVYIISFVKGKSDKLNQFTKYRMVDVYDLNSKKYLESFYLPNEDISKAKDFYILNEKIYLLFNNKVNIYEIN